MTPHIGMSGLMLSILAYDDAAQALGIAMVSSSVAVGSRCPYLAPGKAVMTSQGFTNMRVGALALDLVANGLTASEVMDALRKHDRWMDFRQIAIVSVSGDVQTHTGASTKDWSGHLMQNGLAVLGNDLPNPAPLHALFDRFRSKSAVPNELPLAERLLDALEHARDMLDGCRAMVSSALLVKAPAETASIDLRVDLAHALPQDGGCAVTDLRRLYTTFHPLAALYVQRSHTPDLDQAPELQKS